MTRLGIITGLLSEANLIAATLLRLDQHAARPLIFCSGGDAPRARRALERFIAQGAGALMSFGIAGGLDPSLPSGTLVVAEAVVTPENQRLTSDAPWRRRLLGKAADVVVADIAGSQRVVCDAGAKGALHRLTGAVAVDMESHTVAAAAAAADLPFLALRAIADPAGRDVPSAALAGQTADGSIRVLPVVRQVLFKPWELPALIGLAGDYRRAMAALQNVVELAGPLFGLI